MWNVDRVRIVQILKKMWSNRDTADYSLILNSDA